MPSSAILDVAIGIVFIYLFFSMICSVVNEAIASLLALRAKNLVLGINSLFSGSKTSTGAQFVQEIYQHGLIRGLYKDPPDQAVPDAVALADKWMHVDLPSYIPSRTFAAALLDILVPSDGKAPRALTDVRNSIANLPDSAAKTALASLSANTQQELSDFESQVEDWYNDSMERAASWYKRRTQIKLLAIGLLIAGVMNVDSVRIALTLWNNPVARQAAVDVAQKYVDSNSPATKGPEDFEQVKKEAKTLTSVGQTLPVPFGWESDKEANPERFCVSWSNRWFWLEKLLGLFITALALSLGAPFWFDMLNKFMMVRSTVKPQPQGDKKDS